MPDYSKLTPVLDKYAISTSALCAVHCLCLPLILAVVPALSTSIFGQEMFHQLLLWVVIPLSLISLSIGCKKHKSRFVATFGLIGLAVLALAATLGHDMLSEQGEQIATLIGAASIASAHVRNYTLCRKTNCNHTT